MATQTGPKIPVFVGASDGDTYTPPANRMLRMQQALIQPNVIDILNDPPVSPANGDTYIVGVGTGAWAGHDNDIAYWTTQDLANPAGVWEFYTPLNGWLVSFVEVGGGLAARFFRFDGTEWTVPRMIGEAGVSNFDGLGAAITVNMSPGFLDTSYFVHVSYDYPTTDPGILSVEYVSATQFKIHSSSATDASNVRYFMGY